ncbi:hypothetical protein [Salipiger thiooxidans]|uniref:hypothetical protein n=1 Tax=Salipiger thiooxidans TaxID=282683 RepID=UPI001CD5BB70|nr:hypothetical protein [Salipiger thiooxidans]MCA0847187.1 hypothetical protein [Salipiger thiooxidans]
MSINKTIVRGQCSSCGWRSQRQYKNMSKPCPKCGGTMVVDESDQESMKAMAIIAIVAMVVLAVVFSALGVGK